MAIPNLNFRGSVKSLGGKFTPSSARKMIDEQFKGLPPAARAHMIKKIGSGEMIHAADFNEIVTETHKKGYISGEHAERIKDLAHSPEKGKYEGVDFNDHWK